MSSQKNKTVSCSFSLLDEGRTYTGNHRKYLIANARDICNSPAVREKIRLREALGFYGHGRRILAGRMNIGEVEAIQLPDGGTAIVSNIPSNVTTAFEVAEDGTVTHTQEILNSETGKIVSGLHESRVGGFSWACPGKDAGARGITSLSGFAGFDYVLSPGFAHNRGYILESSGGAEQAILESVAATLRDDAKAEQYVRGWTHDFHERLSILEDQLFESVGAHAEALCENGRLSGELGVAKEVAQRLLEEKKSINAGLREFFESVRTALPVFIPDEVMHGMLNGDFQRASAVFESAARVDFGQYPLAMAGRDAQQRDNVADGARQMPDLGSVEYGEGLFEDRARLWSA